MASKKRLAKFKVGDKVRLKSRKQFLSRYVGIVLRVSEQIVAVEWPGSSNYLDYPESKLELIPKYKKIILIKDLLNE